VTPLRQIVEHVRWQARACADLGSPLSAAMLSLVADDLEAGGPSVAVLADYPGHPQRDALGIRVLGGLHRLVLAGRAPGLAAYYPSVGGSDDPAAARAAVREVLTEHAAELRAGLGQAPQTNEVGRAAALIGGLHHVTAHQQRPLRLVEIGASAGLNLRADHFRVELGGGEGVGPAGSPVVLRDAWRGSLPPLQAAPSVVDRLGCDPSPVDPTTASGRELLTSYVWADQTERLDRLRAALEVAARVPAMVEAAGAGDFLERLDLVPGTTTVLWHSVVWQYLSGSEQDRVRARIEALGAQAEPRQGFAHLAFEPRGPADGDSYEFRVTLQLWPGGEAQLLGTAAPHGLPTTWS
jgi:hypothetical protein